MIEQEKFVEQKTNSEADEKGNRIIEQIRNSKYYLNQIALAQDLFPEKVKELRRAFLEDKFKKTGQHPEPEEMEEVVKSAPLGNFLTLDEINDYRIKLVNSVFGLSNEEILKRAKEVFGFYIENDQPDNAYRVAKFYVGDKDRIKKAAELALGAYIQKAAGEIKEHEWPVPEITDVFRSEFYPEAVRSVDHMKTAIKIFKKNKLPKEIIYDLIKKGSSGGLKFDKDEETSSLLRNRAYKEVESILETEGVALDKIKSKSLVKMDGRIMRGRKGALEYVDFLVRIGFLDFEKRWRSHR